MANAKVTLSLICIFAILLLTKCSKVASGDTPSPAPAQDNDSSPSPTPSEKDTEDAENAEDTENGEDGDDAKDEDDAKDADDSEDAEELSPTPSLSSGPAADSPLSISELFELSLPEIGVQKAAVGPLSDGAKIANKQLEGVEHKIVEFKETLKKRQAKAPSKEAKKCLDQCQKNLDDGIDGVKKGIESINSQDFSKANVDISGVATDVETCNDCFMESDDGEDREINAFNLWVKGVTKECLSNLKNT